MSTCLGRCTICTLVLEPDDFVGLKCGHTYHNECITKWITHAKNCPKCRTKNTTRDITKLYVDDVDSNATINGNFLESISLAERDQRIKNLEAQLKGSNEQRDKFESELKQQMSKVAQIRLTLSTKESQLRLIEHRLEDQTALKVRLESAMAHLKTTEFYALLSRKCHADEATIARELNKYLDQNSNPNPTEFLTLIRSQLKKANTDKKELNSQMKELNHQLRRETAEKEKLRRELLEARSELESARKRPALTGFGDSPASKPGRKPKYSMGFSFTAQMEEQQLEETPEKQEEDSEIQIISPTPKRMPQPNRRKSRRQCIDFVDNEQPLQQPSTSSSIGRPAITPILPSPIYPVKAVKPVRLQKKKPYLDIKDKELNEIFSPNLRAHATNSEWKN